jgi:hypothetical protein
MRNRRERKRFGWRLEVSKKKEEKIVELLPDYF